MVKGAKNNKSKSSGEANVSISLSETGRDGLMVNEDYLLSTATAGCTQIIKALWELPTEQSDAGPLVTLPHYDEVKLPRALVSLLFPLWFCTMLLFLQF